MTDLAARKMRKALPWWYRALCETVWTATPGAWWLRSARARRWLFVIGVNRSGKTTLTNLLRHHPSITVVPNASNLSDALPNSISEACPHVWTERLERFRLTEADVARQDAARLLFDWLSFRPSRRPVMVIESDLPAVQIRWFQEFLPDAYFVGMVRTAYAVAQGIRLKEGYAIERCARQWALANRVMLDDAKHVRNFKIVRYEDFVAEPLQVARDLLDWIGLDVRPVAPHVDRGWRLQNTDRRPSTLRNANPELIGALSVDERALVTAQAADVLERLGYLPEQPE